MAALLINLKINTEEKFNILKKTFDDISYLFPECHVKLRGEFAEKCLVHISETYFGKLETYQNLPSHDWVSATREIVLNIKSETILIYIEDHILTTRIENLSETIRVISENKIDYLAYSFYHANMLSGENILPLNPVKLQNISVFELNQNSEKLLSKISANYFIFSLTSIVSKNYLFKILESVDYKFKIHSSKFSYIIWLIFGYPKNRRILFSINKFLSFFKMGLCLYPPDTPFNVERKCFEYLFLQDANFKYALSDSELFANYDDDNGYYGESCIKRGLYPFHNTVSEIDSHSSSITFNIILKKGELYDATYVNQSHRIRKPPVIKFTVTNGVVLINVGEEKFEIQSGQSKLFYSNKSPIISAINYSEITIHIYDELLS